MNRKTLADVNVAGKTFLLRTDFNVPLNSERRITNDHRIRMALPSIRFIVNRGGRLIIISHLGRPKVNGPESELSLRPVSILLSQLLGRTVAFVDTCIGDRALEAVNALPPGGVLLMENLRFHEGEKQGSAEFARQLAKFADIYVNDAFGTCQRTDASMLALPKAMGDRPKLMGFLVERETKGVDGAV